MSQVFLDSNSFSLVGGITSTNTAKAYVLYTIKKMVSQSRGRLGPTLALVVFDSLNNDVNVFL